MSYTYIVKLDKLTFFAFHGLSEHERKTGNRYEIDISITLTRETPIEDISQTVDYSEIARLITKIMDKFRLKLLEELVLKITDIIEKFYIENEDLKGTKIKKIWVCASKLNPPMGYICKKSSVEFEKQF